MEMPVVVVSEIHAGVSGDKPRTRVAGRAATSLAS